MFYGESKLLILKTVTNVHTNQPVAIKPPVSGSFSLVKLSKKGNMSVLLADDWFACREYFHAVNKGRSRWLYAHRPGYSYKIAAFVHQIEKKLNLKEYTVFGPTQMNRISWIELSPFWLNGSMRRSLFTILLRAGQKYNPLKNNFLEAIQSERYLAETMYAFNRFMSGYTKYTGYITGWFKQFRWGGPPEERVITGILGNKVKYRIHTRTLPQQIKRLLVKPTI